MLRIITTILFTIIATHVAMAQGFAIKGKVLQHNGRGAPYSTILLLKRDSLITSAVSDTTGTYYLNAPRGNYDIVASYIGSNKTITDLIIQNDTIINLTLNPINENILSEVVVLRKKDLIERKIDRVVFNVENSISLIGGNALDAVAKSPGVQINHNNDIGIVGKSSAKIMVNDKLIRLSGEDLASYLKSIPTDQILKIEIITNPPSKYDAEGNSGLINIVTKNRKNEGWFGNITAGTIIRHYVSENLGGTFTYSRNKLTINLGLNARNDRNYIFSEKSLFYPKNKWLDTSYSSLTNRNISGNIGIDYNVSKKMVLGIQYRGSNSENKRSLISQTNIINYNEDLDSVINTNSSLPNNAKTHSVNLHHEYKIDTTGKQLFTDVDYFYYDKGQEQLFSSRIIYPTNNKYVDYPNTYQSTPQKIEIYSMKTDFLLPMKNIDLSMGGKISFIKNNSSSHFTIEKNGEFILDPNRSYTFGYKENTQALYIDAQKEFEKFDIKVGLRGEYTQTTGNSSTLNVENKNSYIKVFPTFYFLLKSIENQSLSFTYGRRINRPEYSRLNPFRIYSNPFLYIEGNPQLQPSFSDNIDIQHVYKKWLISQLFVSYVTNGYDQIGIPDPETGILEIVQRNFLKSFNYGLMESINKTFFKIWENNTLIAVYRNSYTSSDPSTARTQSAWSAFFSTNNTYSLNKSKTLFSSLDFTYHFPMVDGLDHVRRYYNLDFGVKALLAKKNLTLGLSVTDILKTNKVYFNNTINNVGQYYGSYAGTRSLRLSVSYKFGKSFSSRSRNSNSNDSERIRLGQ